MEHDLQFGGTADHEVEQLAIERAEEHERVRLPASAEELIAATIDPSTGAVDRLLPTLSRAAVGSLSSLQDVLLQISMILRTVLVAKVKKGKEEREEPRDFTKHLARSVQGFNDPKASAALADIAEYVVAELHPLFLKAWQEYALLAEPLSDEAKERLGLPKNIQEFFEMLKTGMVDEQKVHSLFGLFALMAEKNPHFPHLKSETQELPKEIVVIDPLAKNHASYWAERVAAHKALYGKEMRLSGLVQQRTVSAIYELRQIKTLDQELKKAAENVCEWLESEQGQLEGLDNEAFFTYTTGLHFAYGDPEILITLLNSLETIKQKSPYLYVRLLSRSPNPVTPEDTKSDMFGNALHIAFHRSMNLQTGKDTEEYQALQSFLTGLTRMDARQDAIAPLSDEEFEYMEKTFSEYIQKGVDEGNFMPAVFSAVMFGEKKRAYLMGKMLEKVSAENRERLLHELRTATPNEFIRLMQGRRLLPKPLIWYGETRCVLPPDITAVLVQRGFLENEVNDPYVRQYQNIFPYLLAHLNFTGRAMVTFFGLSNFAGTINANERLNEFEQIVSSTLWKTTPSEKLLGIYGGGYASKEFYEYLKKAAKDKENTSSILDILNAHPDITALQWRDFVRLPGEFSNSAQSFAFKVIRPFFENLSVEQLLSSPSQFFRVYSHIYNEGYEGALQNIRPNHSVESNLFELLTAMYSKVFKNFLTTLNDPTTAGRQSITRDGWASERLIDFRGPTYENRELYPYEKAVMENLQILTKLFDPEKLADLLGFTFEKYSGAFDLFLDLLSENERKLFLERLSYNTDKKIKDNKRQHVGLGRFEENEINFYYVLLRSCQGFIPKNEYFHQIKSAAFSALGTYMANEKGMFLRVFVDFQSGELALQERKDELVGPIHWKTVDSFKIQ